MKIIILGAGQVGTSVATILAKEAHNDITVIDQDAEALNKLKDRFDLRTIQGYAAHPSVLQEAGADDADMLLAVTNNDETNMIACQVAWSIFHIPTKIARVRTAEYSQYPKLFAPQGLGLHIDMIISPEQLVTDYIKRLLEYPGALQVLDFVNGRVRLVCVKAYEGGPLVGQKLRVLNQHLRQGEARVAAIYRQGQAICPDGDTIIKPQDEVFFIAAPENIPAVMQELRRSEKPYTRLLFAGGGNIGHRLAMSLEEDKRFQKIVIFEFNPERVDLISQKFRRTMVIEGNATDEELLKEEKIDKIDVFCAVTDKDETNILSAMLAKSLGARTVMALINRPSYINLVEANNIDIAISPQQITLSELLAHIGQGVDVTQVYSLRNGAAEAIEIMVHGDAKNSKVVGRRIEQLDLPEGATIAAIVRDQEVVIAHHDTVIESDDRVIIFSINKDSTREIKRLFRVSQGFIG